MLTFPSRNKYKEFADPACDVCQGEGRVEDERIGSDGEPHYYWIPCVCTEGNVK